jgi:HAE1 family hydrophobic/amphiphilic exporter-1
VLVQNRVAIAEPTLPEEVTRQGVTTKKQSTNIILVIALTSPDGTYDSLFLSNYATLRLRDELSRVRGVGEVTVFGTGAYSMRVCLRPRIRRFSTRSPCWAGSAMCLSLRTSLSRRPIARV